MPWPLRSLAPAITTRQNDRRSGHLRRRFLPHFGEAMLEKHLVLDGAATKALLGNLVTD